MGGFQCPNAFRATTRGTNDPLVSSCPTSTKWAVVLSTFDYPIYLYELIIDKTSAETVEYLAELTQGD